MIYKLQNILSGIDGNEHAVADRRKLFTKIFKAAAISLIPIGMSKTAHAVTDDDRVVDATLVWLWQAYIQEAFYAKGLQEQGLITNSNDRVAIQMIHKHKAGHIKVLREIVESKGRIPDEANEYDFTAGRGEGNGPFPDVMNDFTSFLEVAQLLEDMCIRHFKAQAGNYVSDARAIELAHRMHTTCGRHAAKIRMMRIARGVAIKPWVTQEISGIDNTTAKDLYKGEKNTLHETIQGLRGITVVDGYTISEDATTEAFDEPMSQADIIPFINSFTVR